MNALFLLGTFIVLLFLNVPILVAIGLACVIYLMIFQIVPMDMLVSTYFSAMDSFPLIAIPFFILAGELMVQGGISTRMINLCRALMGTVTGALGMVTAMASMAFGAVSGSGSATVAAIGGITVPEMIKEKYDKRFAGAIAAASGCMGPILPPSIAMIILVFLTTEL